MKKYRKKPVVVEAMLYTGENYTEIVKWINGEVPVIYIKNEIILYSNSYYDNSKSVLIGDYIIKGVNGEFYPCKPDRFEKTYEE